MKEEMKNEVNVENLINEIKSRDERIYQLTKENEQLKKSQKSSLANGQFIYSEDKKTIVFKTRSKGQTITGVAKCNVGDKYNVEFGKALAQLRCEMNIRKRDLEAVREVKEKLHEVIDFFDIQGKSKQRCRLWDIYYQDACEQEKMQLDHYKWQQTIVYAMTHKEEVRNSVNIDLDGKDYKTSDDYIHKLPIQLKEALANYEAINNYKEKED